MRQEKASATMEDLGKSTSDKLVSRVENLSLNSNEPRDYVLYACPTGLLAEKLHKFWSESKDLAWNGAHNRMPHITLVSFFKAPHDSAKQMADILKTLVVHDEYLDRIDLEPYISPNFIGLFVDDKQGKWLRIIATRFVNKLRNLGITAEAGSKSLHLTLAYHFSGSLFQSLCSMVEKLRTTGASTTWELRLYSRDSRFRDYHVHKVTHAHAPKEHDELELKPGEYIYLHDGVCDASTDGWVEGISSLTGTSGYLPLNHTNRTSESESWTLHASVRITKGHSVGVEIPETRKSKISSSMNESWDTLDGVAIDKEPVEASESRSTSSREIFICRHGERVDFAFGSWIPYCFESNGVYVRRDLNMPKELPTRNIRDYQNDSPLTTLGEMQANLLGDAMKSSNVRIDVAFASPSLRCVQTLSQILKGFETDIKINIEPGLIEWLAWYPNGLPTWMTSKEFNEAGFKVNDDYEPIIRTEDLPNRENAAQYYERSHAVIKRMIDNTVGNILIVAHAASLAACTRQLIGGRVPPAAEITRLVQRVPYLACLTAKQETDGSWQIHSPPFPPITHTSNSRFDWKILV